MHPRRRLIPVAALVLSLALLAVPATAASPVGTYECKLAGYSIELKDSGKYKFNAAKGKSGGKWKADGKEIIFKSGPLSDVYGKLAHGVLKIYDVRTDQFFDKCPRK